MGRNAGAIVFHAHAQSAAGGAACGDFDSTLGWRELDGIRQQIDQHLVDGALVRHDLGQRVGHVHAHVDLLFGRLEQQQVIDLFHRDQKADGLVLQFPAAIGNRNYTQQRLPESSTSSGLPPMPRPFSSK